MTFDLDVFDENISQSQMFENAAKDIVDQFLRGINCAFVACLFVRY